MITATKTEVQTSAGRPISPALAAVCDALQSLVTSGIDVHRCLAAKALGRIGNRSAAEVLTKALLDEDEDVRVDAAEALLALGDPMAADQLFENMLGDPSAEVKLAAISALAKLKETRIIPWLRRMVKGRDEEIAWDEEEFYSSGWDDWVEIQIRAIQALAEIGAAEAVPDIVAAIFDENAQDMTETAFRALAKLGPDGINALAGFLGQKDTRLRRRAASVLAGINDLQAQQLLALALEDPVAEVRLAALRARGKIDAKDPILAPLLTDEADTTVRIVAVQLLGRYHAQVLRGLLDDPSPRVLAAALAAFAASDDAKADDILAERLCQFARVDEADISVAAGQALAGLAPDVACRILPELLTDSEKSLAIRLGALKSLAGLGGVDVIETLISILDDDQRLIRVETMSALAGLAAGEGDQLNPAAEALLDALNGAYDPEPEEAEPAVEEAEVPEASIEDSEVDADDEIDVEAEKIAAFPTSTLEAMLSEAPGIAPLAGLPEKGIELSKTDMERLAIARNVIGKKKITKAEIVITHDDIRRFSARVLGTLNHKDVAQALAQALGGQDAETSLAAAESLTQIGARGLMFDTEISKILLDNIANADRALKLMLVRALAYGAQQDVLAQLQSSLTDEDSFVRNEALRALGHHGWQGPEIEDLLCDAEPSVRFSAARIMAKVDTPENVNRLVDFSTEFEGYHGRKTAILLRDLNAELANLAYLRVLQDEGRKRVWSVAIEALEELNQRQVFDLRSQRNKITTKENRGTFL